MQTSEVCGGGGGDSTSVKCMFSIPPLPRAAGPVTHAACPAVVAILPSSVMAYLNTLNGHPARRASRVRGVPVPASLPHPRGVKW